MYCLAVHLCFSHTDTFYPLVLYIHLSLLVEAGAEVMVSACPSCKRNLQLGASRLRKEKEVRIQVMDITEIMAKCL